MNDEQEKRGGGDKDVEREMLPVLWSCRERGEDRKRVEDRKQALRKMVKKSDMVRREKCC